MIEPVTVAAVEMRLRAASRWSAVLTAVGGVAVVAGLVYAAVALAQLRDSLAAVQSQKTAAERELNRAQTQLASTQATLSRSRCALQDSRAAINAFHARDYRSAISLYGEALRCDPDNAYLLNLLAYAQFQSHDLEQAVATEERSVQADPNYAWGYFDLARFYCAQGGRRKSEALAARDRALKLRPDLAAVMAGDGQFQQLCRPLLGAG